MGRPVVRGGVPRAAGRTRLAVRRVAVIVVIVASIVSRFPASTLSMRGRSVDRLSVSRSVDVNPGFRSAVPQSSGASPPSFSSLY